MRRPSIKPSRPFTPRESAWGFPPSLPRATTWARCRPTSTRTSPPSARRCSSCPRPRPSWATAPASWNASPKQALEEFYKLDPTGNIDKIIERLIPNAPAVKQAEAKLQQARADLDQALLNLRYCDVASEIDGVVTRRNVNPGNNVQAGQSLMAVRSLTEIWIDANFKETQLADLRIGHRVRLRGGHVRRPP